MTGPVMVLLRARLRLIMMLFPARPG